MSSKSVQGRAPLAHPIYWLRGHGQRLGLLPSLGGGWAAWQYEHGDALVNLLRPWDGHSADRYHLASFALVPWSNRIGAGGFEAQGRHHPVRPNRVGEPYPIHGDGWLQEWTLEQTAPHCIEMHLHSRHFDANPHHYRAVQRFTLVPQGLQQTLEVTHLGAQPLPYGLGQHPYFIRRADTRVQAQVQGVWLSGADPMPTRHSTTLPADWDLRQGISAMGSALDHAFTGWDGSATITWAHLGLALQLQCPQVRSGAWPGYCLVYRPPHGDSFCFEPLSHPIDAFHLDGQPGLVLLQTGQSLRQDLHWHIRPMNQTETSAGA